MAGRPFDVNCYGSSTISKRGAFAHIDGTGSDEPDLPGPSPARCFALGAATARALKQGDWRVAVVASSSWSHSFLTAKNHYFIPIFLRIVCGLKRCATVR